MTSLRMTVKKSRHVHTSFITHLHVHVGFSLSTCTPSLSLSGDRRAPPGGVLSRSHPTASSCPCSRPTRVELAGYGGSAEVGLLLLLLLLLILLLLLLLLHIRVSASFPSLLPKL